jgi:hypothetical protein
MTVPHRFSMILLAAAVLTRVMRCPAIATCVKAAVLNEACLKSGAINVETFQGAEQVGLRQLDRRHLARGEGGSGGGWQPPTMTCATTV